MADEEAAPPAEEPAPEEESKPAEEASPPAEEPPPPAEEPPPPPAEEPPPAEPPPEEAPPPPAEEAPPPAEEAPPPAEEAPPPAEEAPPPAEEAPPPAEEAPPPAEEPPPPAEGGEAPAPAEEAPPPAAAEGELPAAEEAPPPAEQEGEAPPAAEAAPAPAGEGEAPAGEAAKPPGEDAEPVLPGADGEALLEPVEAATGEEGQIVGDTGAEEATGAAEELKELKAQTSGELAATGSAEAGIDVAAEPKEESPDALENFLRKSEEFARTLSSITQLSRSVIAIEKEEKRKEAEKKKRRTLGSVISIQRGGQEYYERQKAPKYQNSYKLDSDKSFNIEKVELILKDVLTRALEDIHYDTDKVPKQAKWASSAIRAKLKAEEYDRYKIICVVTIGEKRSQDMYILMRFLWDADRDKYAIYVHDNVHVFAVAMCFGFYYE